MKVDRENKRIELVESLKTSLNDIVYDAQRYDKGNFNAIKRSSITLRSLLYTTNRNESIFTQLGLDNELKFATFTKDFSKYKTAISFGALGFARFKVKNNVAAKPLFYDTMIFSPTKPNKPIDYLNFTDWWDQPLIVFRDHDKGTDTSLTRKHLILKEANQDGPAHFDDKIDDIYQQYKNGKTALVAGGVSNPVVHQFYIGGYTLNKDTLGKPTHIKDVTLSLTRQIVHELLITINKNSHYYINYKPDFEYNFKRKLNYFSWWLSATK